MVTRGKSGLQTRRRGLVIVCRTCSPSPKTEMGLMSCLVCPRIALQRPASSDEWLTDCVTTSLILRFWSMRDLNLKFSNPSTGTLFNCIVFTYKAQHRYNWLLTPFSTRTNSSTIPLEMINGDWRPPNLSTSGTLHWGLHRKSFLFLALFPSIMRRSFACSVLFPGSLAWQCFIN